jgi:hypothetical protein
MLRVYHLFLGIILLPLAPWGVKIILPEPSPAIVENPSSTAMTSTHSKTPTAIEENTWKKIIGKTPVPKGWQVAPCEESNSLLCVSSQGQLLGTVEIEVYPVNNNGNFQKNLTDAGIPLNSQVDYQSTEYQNKLLTALKAWVTDLNSTLVKDRQDNNGNKIVFSAYPPQQALVGKLQGLRYGFVGIQPEKGVEAQHINYITFDGSNLYVINTSFDPGSVTGKFDKLENLAIFQPYLSAIAADLKLPM